MTVNKSSALEDFGKFFEEETLSDVTLVASGKEIRAHKSILAARSAVFAAMFMHEMQEQKQNRVEITDFDHDTIKEMVRFMYTDQAPNINKMATDLLGAADKYALEGLKLKCGEVLQRNLTEETVSTILMLAESHSIATLKKQAIDFINSSSQLCVKVLATNGWKKLVSTYPYLSVEVHNALVSKLHSMRGSAPNRCNYCGQTYKNVW